MEGGSQAVGRAVVLLPLHHPGFRPQPNPPPEPHASCCSPVLPGIHLPPPPRPTLTSTCLYRSLHRQAAWCLTTGYREYQPGAQHHARAAPSLGTARAAHFSTALGLPPAPPRYLLPGHITHPGTLGVCFLPKPFEVSRNTQGIAVLLAHPLLLFRDKGHVSMRRYPSTEVLSKFGPGIRAHAPSPPVSAPSRYPYGRCSRCFGVLSSC